MECSDVKLTGRFDRKVAKIEYVDLGTKRPDYIRPLTLLRHLTTRLRAFTTRLKLTLGDLVVYILSADSPNHNVPAHRPSICSLGLTSRATGTIFQTGSVPRGPGSTDRGRTYICIFTKARPAKLSGFGLVGLGFGSVRAWVWFSSGSVRFGPSQVITGTKAPQKSRVPVACASSLREHLLASPGAP